MSKDWDRVEFKQVYHRYSTWKRVKVSYESLLQVARACSKWQAHVFNGNTYWEYHRLHHKVARFTRKQMHFTRY